MAANTALGYMAMMQGLETFEDGYYVAEGISFLENILLRLIQAADYDIERAEHGIIYIDEINILQATYEAMREAVGKLDPAPDLLLNDAVTIPGVEIRQVPIIKGDAKSISIGAASIVAKVTRDRLMEQYADVFPEYDFASNKGYGSAAHIAALKEYGPTPIHRHSFIKNFGF